MTGKQMKASRTFRYSLRTKWEHGGGNREQQEKVCTRKVRENENSSLCQMLDCDYYLVAAALIPEMTCTPRPDPQCSAHPPLADKHTSPAFTLWSSWSIRILFRSLETEGQGCLFMPNPFSVKSLYVFLGTPFITTYCHYKQARNWVLQI